MKKMSLFVMLALASGSSYASGAFDWLCNLNPYLGIDAQVRYMEFKRGFGDTEFNQKFYPQGNAFVGLKFTQYFGVEVGYFNSFTVRNNSVASLNESLGSPLGPGQIDISNNKALIKGFNAYLVGYYPINDCNRFIGQIGIARAHVTLSYQPFATQAGITEANVISELHRNFSARRTIASAKIGFEHFFTKLFGVRMMVGWDNTRRFKNIPPTEAFSSLRASIKDSLIMSLGVTINF